MIPEVIRTPRAELDLLEIWLHIAEDSPSAADRLLESIDQTCHTLAQYPLMGRSRPELAPELRSFPAGNYIIFYRPIENGIEVVRVVIGTRDINAFF